MCLSFPGSAWERLSARLCLASSVARGRASRVSIPRQSLGTRVLPVSPVGLVGRVEVAQQVPPVLPQLLGEVAEVLAGVLRAELLHRVLVPQLRGRRRALRRTLGPV